MQEISAKDIYNEYRLKGNTPEKSAQSTLSLVLGATFDAMETSAYNHAIKQAIEFYEKDYQSII